MRVHANHRTCPSSRQLLCRRVLEEGWTLRRAAEAAGCSARTGARWLRRLQEGDHGLVDRSSRPHRCPSRLPQPRVQAIEALRQVRMTAAEIAEVLNVPLSTVSLWLKRIGLGKRSLLEPPEAAEPLRAPAPRRARPRRDQEARSYLDPGRRAPSARASWKPVPATGRGPTHRPDRLRVPARDDRRSDSPRLCRGTRRSDRSLRDRVLVPRRRLVCRTRPPPGGDER